MNKKRLGNMSAIAGIVSINLQYPLEKLHSMLLWGSHHTSTTHANQFSTSQTESVSIGMTDKNCFFDDVNTHITVALLGTVLDRKSY